MIRERDQMPIEAGEKSCGTVRLQVSRHRAA